jgi:hypothetical protein
MLPVVMPDHGVDKTTDRGGDKQAATPDVHSHDRYLLFRGAVAFKPQRRIN